MSHFERVHVELDLSGDQLLSESDRRRVVNLMLARGVKRTEENILVRVTSPSEGTVAVAYSCNGHEELVLVRAQAAREAVSLKRDDIEIAVRLVKRAKLGPAVERAAQMIHLAVHIK